MTTLEVALALAGVALLVSIAVAATRTRPRQRAPEPVAPRRAYDLEEHVGDLLTGPMHRYGKIFTHYEVWRFEQETRLELHAGTPWRKLNDFARSLVVRYLWQALERIAGAAVVVVDTPRQQWDKDADLHFQDEGWDWLTFPSPWTNGPQFVKE
jgi:hypothetical protein